MSAYPVVGFLNHGILFPNFVVTIVDMQGSYAARAPFPGTKLFGIPGVTNEEDLFCCSKFWKDTEERRLDTSRDEFAFAFSRRQVVIGTLEELVREIQKQYASKAFSLDTLGRLASIIYELKKNPVSCFCFA